MPDPGVTCHSVVSMHNIREHYLSFIAPTGSCARPHSSCQLDFTLDQQVFADCCETPAGRWPFPTLSLQSLRRCLDPYPVASLQCICSFLAEGQRPHLRRQRFGTPDNPLLCNFNRGHYSQGCSHSFMFRLPRSLDPQIAPTAKAKL